jgi:hypothetical protein
MIRPLGRCYPLVSETPIETIMRPLLWDARMTRRRGPCHPWQQWRGTLGWNGGGTEVMTNAGAC